MCGALLADSIAVAISASHSDVAEPRWTAGRPSTEAEGAPTIRTKHRQATCAPSLLTAQLNLTCSLRWPLCNCADVCWRILCCGRDLDLLTLPPSSHVSTRTAQHCRYKTFETAKFRMALWQPEQPFAANLSWVTSRSDCMQDKPDAAFKGPARISFPAQTVPCGLL